MVRIHLRWHLEHRDELVATDVERAQRHRQRVHDLGDLAVRLVLLVFARWLTPIDVEELGAVEPDAAGTVAQRAERLRRQLDVRAQLDELAGAELDRAVTRLATQPGGAAGPAALHARDPCGRLRPSGLDGRAGGPLRIARPAAGPAPPS